MAIAIDLSTKADATTVDGLSFYRYAKSAAMVCQLDAELQSGMYCELTCVGSNESSAMISLSPNIKGTTFQTTGIAAYWAHDGQLYPGGISYGSTWGINDVVGVSMLGTKIRFWKNGVAQPEIAAPAAGYRFPSVLSSTTRSVIYAGRFVVYASDMQYRPNGYAAIGGERPLHVLPTPIILATMPHALTRGFR